MYKKKIQNKFSLFDVKLSLLRREYLLLVANLLTNSLKNLHIPKRELFPFSYIHSDQ